MAYRKKYKSVRTLMKAAQTQFQNDQSESGKVAANRIVVFEKTFETTYSKVEEVFRYCGEYDLSSSVPGNGHRSFVLLYSCFLDHFLEIFKSTKKKWFQLQSVKIKEFLDDFESWNEAFKSYNKVLSAVIWLHKKSKGGSLFIEDYNCKVLNGLLGVSGESIYGRAAGLQYPKSMQTLVKGMGAYVLMAWNTYKKGKKRGDFNELYEIYKYIHNDDKRGRELKQMEMKIQGTDSDFVRFFFKKPPIDTVVKFNKLFNPTKLAIIQAIQIPTKVFTMKTSKGNVEIATPQGKTGAETLPCRLLSSSPRKGMTTKKKGKELPPSEDMIILISAAPFMCRGADDGDPFMSNWAKNTSAPVVAIGYTSALDAMFPTQIEECFFSYCWIIKNAASFGSTAKRVILYGISVGGALALGVMMKCMEKGIPLPGGIFFSTSVFRFNPLSPSHLLTILDGMVPMMSVIRLAQMYFGKSIEAPTGEQKGIDPYVSPLFMSDEMLKKLPPVCLATTTLDMCQDDSVEMAKRLQKLGKKPKLMIIPDLCHNFINFAKLNDIAKEAQEKCDAQLKKMLNAI